MNETYRTAELENARNELANARQVYEALKAKGWNKKTRDAAEQVEFWGNKAAFLANVR